MLHANAGLHTPRHPGGAALQQQQQGSSSWCVLHPGHRRQPAVALWCLDGPRGPTNCVSLTHQTPNSNPKQTKQFQSCS